MTSRQLTKTQMIEQGIPNRIALKDTLHGLAEIACYCGVSVQSIRRLIKNRGLPAVRSTGSRGGNYFTTKRNIETWVRQAHLEHVEHHNWDKQINHKGSYPVTQVT